MHEICLKHITVAKRLGVSLMVCELLLGHPFTLGAQEPSQQGQRAAGGLVTEMQQMQKRTKKMRQEMIQELQKQVSGLRAHAHLLEGISDEQQLLSEMRKHLQMVDTLLGTMVEQRTTTEATLKEEQEQLWGLMGKTRQPRDNEPKGHEALGQGEE